MEREPKPQSDPNAAAPGASPLPKPEELAVLQRENQQLREEVLRLLRVESNLARDNAALERRSAAYRQLSELGKRFNRGIAQHEIAAALVQFALYTVNLERCAVLLRVGEEFRTVAADGYFDPEEERAIGALALSLAEPLLLALQQSEQPSLRTLQEASALDGTMGSADPIAQRFLLDEYALLPLRDETSGKLLGFLVAGSSRRKASHHHRIQPGEPLLLSLQSLVELAAVTLRAATLRETLQAERRQLEERVSERTIELARVNELLRVELKERESSEQQRAALYESVVQAQAARIAELSTPILPITDQILVLPLIGVMDAQRIEQLGSAVLEGAVQRRARVVLLDLTGVQSPDRGLALALGKTARALGLVGVRTLLTGIGAELARILVTDGTPLESLSTSSSLQAGIAEALRLAAAAGMATERPVSPPPKPSSRRF